MQRAPIVLESRHRLLHLRASLERKWSQPRRQSMYTGPSSLKSKLRPLRRNDLMATDMGKLQRRKNIIMPIIWKRDSSRSISKGSTIAFWKILNFVHLNSIMIEMKRSVSRWTSLRTVICPSTWRKQKVFDTTRIGGPFSISLETLDPLRNRSEFNEALTTSDRLHQESGERQLRPSAILEVSILAPIIEFSFQFVEMERYLVELIIIQRKSTTELTCKAPW